MPHDCGLQPMLFRRDGALLVDSFGGERQGGVDVGGGDMRESFQQFGLGAACGEPFQDQFDRYARPRDARLAQHDGGISRNA
jgi:hypothetical protein